MKSYAQIHLADGFGCGGCDISVSGTVSGSQALGTTCCFLARPASVPEADAVPLLRSSAAYTSSLIFAITSSIVESDMTVA